MKRIVLDEQKKTKKGHTECYIQNTLLFGFVDPGSDITIMGHKLAKEPNLKIVPDNTLVVGYGDLRTCKAIGFATEEIRLEVCLVTAEIHIVFGNVQIEEIIIGKNAVDHENVVGVTYKGCWSFRTQNKLI